MLRSLPLLFAPLLAVPSAEVAPMPQPAGPITFADVVRTAAADAASLPLDQAARTRYLDARNLPAATRREAFAVLAYHVNALSRESKRTPPREVMPWLWAIRLDDYRWSADTWESLAGFNAYFAIRVK